MSSIATVSDKGQVTLPKPVRDRLGIAPGTKLGFEVDANGELRVRVLAQGSAALLGLLARPGEPVRSLSDMDAGVTPSVQARAGRRRCSLRTPMSWCD